MNRFRNPTHEGEVSVICVKCKREVENGPFCSQCGAKQDEFYLKRISAPDNLLNQAINIAVEEGVASVQILQRQLKIGYTNAARLIDQMEAQGIIGPFNGAKPREVLINREQADHLIQCNWQPVSDSDTK